MKDPQSFRIDDTDPNPWGVGQREFFNLGGYQIGNVRGGNDGHRDG